MAIKHSILQKGGVTKTINLTPMKAIRQKCLECCAWSFKEVKECPCPNCALYPFRYGRRIQKVGG